MSDSELYSRLLFPKKQGYPLFYPEPSSDLPEPARRYGTQIGDVGVVTPGDGSFDPIFNILRAGDDPENRFGVPQGFEQVRLGPGEIRTQPLYHLPGSDVSNVTVNKKRLDIEGGVENNVFFPFGAGAVVEVSANSKQTGLLLLPDGASRWDLRPQQKFRNYALKHGQSWYAFVNGELGRMIGNGDLYLVTGVTKCTSWSVAAVENQSGDGKVSLKLKAAQVGNAGASCTWEWESASSSVNSGPRRFGEESWRDNQTVFLRGFKVTMRSTPLRRSPKVLAIINSRWSDMIPKTTSVPYSQPQSQPGPSSANNFLQSPAAFSLVPNSTATSSVYPTSSPASVPVPAALGRPKSSSSASTEERRTNRGDGDYVKRPENAFILFRRKCCEDRALSPYAPSGSSPSPFSASPSLGASPSSADAPSFAGARVGKKERHADLSRIISAQWKALSPAERAHWEALAREKKREHEARHPGYVYRPRTGKHYTPSSSLSAASASGSGAAGKAKSSAPQEGQAAAQVTQSRPLSEQQSLEADSLFRGPLHTPSSSDDEQSLNCSPNVYHPSNVINDYLLNCVSDAMVAVTHDDEWASVVNEADDQVPENDELTRRILSKFSIDDLSDGVCLKARTHTPGGQGMAQDNIQNDGFLQLPVNLPAWNSSLRRNSVDFPDHQFSPDELSSNPEVSGMGMSLKPLPSRVSPPSLSSSAPPSQPKLPINFNTFVEQYIAVNPPRRTQLPHTPSSSSSHSNNSADNPNPKGATAWDIRTRDIRWMGDGEDEDEDEGASAWTGESTLSSDSEDAFREDEVFTRRAPCVFADGAGTYDCVAGPDLGFEFAPEEYGPDGEILSPVSMSL